MMTYYHHHQSGAISQNTQQRNSTESDGMAFEEKLSTRLRWQMTQNIRNAHHTLFHRLRNCTATTKDTGLLTAALSTADVLISSPLRQTFLPQKSQRSQSSLTCWSTAVEEKERERKCVCVCVCLAEESSIFTLKEIERLGKRTEAERITEVSERIVRVSTNLHSRAFTPNTDTGVARGVAG